MPVWVACSRERAIVHCLLGLQVVDSVISPLVCQEHASNMDSRSLYGVHMHSILAALPVHVNSIYSQLRGGAHAES